MLELKPGAKINFKGVCSYTVEVAKNGSSFLRGTVRDRKDVVAFKVWDATSLSVDLFKVVRITGLVKEYNKEIYVEVSEAENVEGNILDFVESSALSPEIMLEDLRGIAKSCSEEWSEKLLEVLKNEEGVLLVASMPGTAHSERSGLLAHIHEAAFSAVAEMNRVERLGGTVNKDVLIAGVILAKLYSVESYIFNVVTGEVVSEDTATLTLLGRSEAYLRAYEEIVGMQNYLEVTNVVGATNYLVDPATPEALIVREAYYSELVTHEAMKLANNTTVGKTSKGTKYTYIGNVPVAE